MGKVSIVLNAVWMEPKNSNIPDDVTAATRAMEFTLGLFANPIYKNGDFPEIVKQQVTNRSIGNSRLPIFSSEEKKNDKRIFGFFCFKFLYISTNIFKLFKPKGRLYE